MRPPLAMLHAATGFRDKDDLAPCRADSSDEVGARIDLGPPPPPKAPGPASPRPGGTGDQQMTDKLTARSPASRRRLKRRELELADGGRLVLDVDGAIRRLDDHGDTIRTWTPDDPDWPNEAIRFGLHFQAPTVAPHGRVPAVKPPRW